MVMLWCWVCAVHGPECTCIGPMPDYQLVPEEVGIGDEPRAPVDYASGDIAMRNSAKNMKRKCFYVLANMALDDRFVFNLIRNHFNKDVKERIIDDIFKELASRLKGSLGIGFG